MVRIDLGPDNVVLISKALCALVVHDWREGKATFPAVPVSLGSKPESKKAKKKTTKKPKAYEKKEEEDDDDDDDE
jgi:ribosomal protein L12E/L44/L45/RPP1/RPP2